MKHTRHGKCAKPTCDRMEQTGGLCKSHYRVSMRAAGIATGTTDAAPVAARIIEFQGLGIGYPQLSELTGIPVNTLWRCVRRKKVILASTAQKIMAVPLPAAPWKVAADKGCVNCIGTTRRLRGLQVLGYTINDLAARLDAHPRTVHIIISGKQPYVWGETARKVDKLFRELQMTRGGSKITIARALKKGWHAPLDWDEDEIDVPDADPSDASSSSRMADWYEDYLELVDLGLSAQRIAERQGLPLDTLKTRLARKQEREERDNYEMEESA